MNKVIGLSRDLRHLEASLTHMWLLIIGRMKEKEQLRMTPRFPVWANGKIWVGAFLEWHGLGLGKRWE